MAESTTSKENLLLPKETHKVDTDDIKMNPKRSRDNMSEDESNDKCIKKPRQEINTEIFHPNTDNNNENKSIIVMNDTDKNNDILEKKSAVQDLNEKKVIFSFFILFIHLGKISKYVYISNEILQILAK